MLTAGTSEALAHALSVRGLERGRWLEKGWFGAGRLVCAHEMLIYGGDLSDTMKEPMPLKGEFVPTFPTRRDTPSPAG